MKTQLFKSIKNLSMALAISFVSITAFGQTVYGVISNSSNHTTLKSAIDAAGLDATLDDAMANFTVFAPDDAAFTSLLAELGISASDLLANPGLADILTYHVLSGTTLSSSITNGDIVTPLNSDNTLKLTVTSTSEVFVNQAEVNAADISATNGVVHSVDQVLLVDETVADVAIDNSFNTLVAAIIEARLLPALSDPFSNYTVFAPTDAAFTALLGNLGISASDLLANPDLANILLYHVLGSEVLASDISNGDIVSSLNPDNTTKMTVTMNGDVYANQAQVIQADVMADNGVVHAIDQVILVNETVVDAAIDNGFTILTQAVVAAELLPALTDPFAEYTVFAPTDAAFTTYITDAGITAADLLANPSLGDILLYHVLGTEVISSDLTNGLVMTLNGADVNIDLSNGVMVNNATVLTADVLVDNGVVHAIDKVLIPGTLSIVEAKLDKISVYPNPTTSFISVENLNNSDFSILNMNGEIVKSGKINANTIQVETLSKGAYFLKVNDGEKLYSSKFIKN